MAKRIIQDRCIKCGICLKECPNDGIHECEGVFAIVEGLCTNCLGVHAVSRCVEVCPTDAVEEGTQEPEPVLAARAFDLRPDLFPRD